MAMLRGDGGRLRRRAMPIPERRDTSVTMWIGLTATSCALALIPLLVWFVAKLLLAA